MQQEKIRYELVWSGWLRLSHWLIATGVVFQVFSAWVIGRDDVDFAYWSDWHQIVGQVILFALLLRLILLFLPPGKEQPASSHWRALLPGRPQRQAMLQVIKFYISLGRYPLPNWYAHNPLWQPVYAVFFIILALSLLSGLFYNSGYSVLGQEVENLHASFAAFITIFSVLHIVTAFLHDLKAKGAFISAMVNGFRYFHYARFNPVTAPITEIVKKQKQNSVYIPIDSLKAGHLKDKGKKHDN